MKHLVMHVVYNEPIAFQEIMAKIPSQRELTRELNFKDPPANVRNAIDLFDPSALDPTQQMVFGGVLLEGLPPALPEFSIAPTPTPVFGF